MKGEPLIDDRAYYVTITHEGAAAPVWRSPWLTECGAYAQMRSSREQCAEAGWRALVRVHYRDGSEVREEG